MQMSQLTLQDFLRRNKEKLRPKWRWNEPMLDYKISMRGPYRSTSNLVALIFVSLSNLTQDQRQVLTSLMAHRIRVLADYRLNELREVYLEIFCTTKTSVDNPLLAPSDGGRKKFLVIDEGYLDSHEGYWVEDEEDGTEGFLEADEDTFWVYDDENYTWFQRRFQRKKDEERIQRRSPKRERQGRQRIRRKTLLQEEGKASHI